MSDRVRYVGETVAAVVAEDRRRLRPRSTTSWSTTRSSGGHRPLAAIEPGADLVEPSWGDNLLITRDWRRVTSTRRSRTPPMHRGTVRSNGSRGCRSRGAVASQLGPLPEQADVLGVDPEPSPVAQLPGRDPRAAEGSIHVIQPHVGGAFGLKQPPFQEQPAGRVPSGSWVARSSGSRSGRELPATGHSRDTRFVQGRVRPTGVIRPATCGVADVGAPTALLGWGSRS